MDTWLQVVLASTGAVVASSGFWAWVLRKSENKSAMTQLMMGLAYIELTTLGMSYINRGHITRDEYEDLRKYFYEPYRALGGNGVAERVMKQVDTLMLVSQHPFAETLQVRNREGEVLNNGRVVTRAEETTAWRS